MYLNIPSIARYEWHPFTISSAPEQKGRPAPTPPAPQGVLLSPCHVPRKAVSPEHRGKQDLRHKPGLPDLPLEHGGRCADAGGGRCINKTQDANLASWVSLWNMGADEQMLTKWGDWGSTGFCEGHRGGPDLVGEVGRVAFQLNLVGFIGVY